MAVSPVEIWELREGSNPEVLSRLEGWIDQTLLKSPYTAGGKLTILYVDAGIGGSLGSHDQRALERKYRDAGWSKVKAAEKSIEFVYPVYRSSGRQVRPGEGSV